MEWNNDMEAFLLRHRGDGLKTRCWNFGTETWFSRLASRWKAEMAERESWPLCKMKTRTLSPWKSKAQKRHSRAKRGEVRAARNGDLLPAPLLPSPLSQGYFTFHIRSSIGSRAGTSFLYQSDRLAGFALRTYSRYVQGQSR